MSTDPGGSPRRSCGVSFNICQICQELPPIWGRRPPRSLTHPVHARLTNYTFPAQPPTPLTLYLGEPPAPFITHRRPMQRSLNALLWLGLAGQPGVARAHTASSTSPVAYAGWPCRGPTGCALRVTVSRHALGRDGKAQGVRKAVRTVSRRSRKRKTRTKVSCIDCGALPHLTIGC